MKFETGDILQSIYDTYNYALVLDHDYELMIYKIMLLQDSSVRIVSHKSAEKRYSRCA